MKKINLIEAQRELRKNAKKDQAWSEKDQVGTKLSSKEAGVLKLEGGSDEHPMSTRSASDGTRWNSRVWKYVAMMALLLTLACGQAWGASPWLLETPTQNVHTQDGITISGEYGASLKMKNSNGKAYTVNNTSLHIFSESTNITAISFEICVNSDGDGTAKAITVETSTGGAFSTPSGAAITSATKNGTDLASLSDIQTIKANKSTVDEIAITFATPVKAIELKKSGGAHIRKIQLTYNSPSSYTTYYAAAIVGSSNDDGSVTTGPTGATVTFDHSTSSQATINTKKYDKMEGNQVINLGTGNTFQVGDQIILDICSSGNNYSAGGIFDLTGSSDPTISVVTSKTVAAQVAYVVVANDGIAGQTSATIGKVSTTSYIHGITVLRAAASCTAPNHVDISGNWDYFGGETISLTATAYSSAGTGSPIADANITGWQWQKLIGTTWTDVSNGTVGSVVTSGATTKNLQITNCGQGNSGKYRCVVSTGATCSTASATATDGSEGYGVKVYVLECYTGGTTVYNFTRDGENQAGSVTINLSASTAYTFKVHADDYYGNSGTINVDETNWVCSTSQGNLTVNSGLGGTFTFDVEYSTGGNSNVEGEPELSVTYPRKTVYLKPNSDWKSNDAKFAFYYFHKDGEDTDKDGWTTGFLSASVCDGDVYPASIPQWNGVKIIGVRFNSSEESPGWNGEGHVWNQTDDLVLTSNDLVEITGWSNNQTYTSSYDAPEYTISFDGNGETSGSMTDVEDIECDASVTLEANAFVKTGYTFTGWKDGSSNDYADEATISNITADIALTAQWTEDKHSVTVAAGSNGTVSPSSVSNIGIATASGDITATANTGYHFTSWTLPSGTSAASEYSSTSNPIHINATADGKTITANFSANTPTITLDDQDATNTPTGSVVATYGSSMPEIATLPTKTGYTFGGFYSDVAGGGTKYYNADGSSAKNSDLASATTLYALWTQSVKIDDNGGSADGSVSVTYKGTAGTPSVPTYAGHTVDLGYYAESSCTNKVMALDGTLQASVTDGSSDNWTNSSSKWVYAGAATLYAHWKCNTPSISFASATNTVTITIPNGTKVYYTTDGSTPDDEDTEYTEAFTIDADCTVKAIAIQSGCTSSDVASEDLTYTDTKAYVTYAAGVTLTSGSVPSDATGYTPGAKVTVLGNTGSMVYTGYTFRGWTSGDYFYKAGDKFTISENTTLTAVWDDGSGGGNCELFSTDFSDDDWDGIAGICRSSNSADTTYNGITFHSYCSPAKQFTVDNSAGTLTWCNNNMGNNYWMAIPVTGVNGSITITVDNSSSETRFNYVLKRGTSITGSPGSGTSSTSADPSTVTIDTCAASNYVVYLGRQGSGLKTMTSITITTPCASSNYTVSFANQTGFAGSTTLPSSIVGVPTGKKLLQPSDPTASGYTFGGWYSDAACTAGNEINWSTMTITADKTIYAKWCANHTVAWVVNGSAYSTGTPTTATTDCDGITTMPTAPADNTLSGCANSFRGWSATNLYGEATNTQPSDLFVTAADAPTINADKTFYAVFGTATSAPQVGTVLWSENWTGEGNNATPSSPTTGGGYAIASGVEYDYTDGTGDNKATTKVATGTNAGGVSPELMVGYGTTTAGAFTVTGLPKKGAKELTLIFKRNNSTTTALTPSVTGEGYSISKVSGSGAGTYVYTITCGAGSTFDLTFTGSTTKDKSVRIDDIVLKVKTDGATNYRCICPSLEVTEKLVTASTPIFITSAASKTVRSQDSLVIVGSGLAKSATLSISSPASKFTLKSSKNGDLTTDATGSIDTVAYIFYNPGSTTEDGLDSNNSFTITDGTNTETVSTALIGRHLPTNFVIAVKKNSKWWALPADKANGTPAPVEITVDDDDDPTTAITTEANVYSLGENTNKITTGDGQYVRLAMHGISPTGGSGYAPLQGRSDNQLGQSGSSTMTGNLGQAYWWQLRQYNTSITNADDAKYYMSCPNNNNSYRVRLYNNSGEKWGQYANEADSIRLIPWLPSYTLTWNTNGGSDLDCDECTSGLLPAGTDIVAPTSPTLSNYVFDGWNTADDGTGSAAADEMPDEDVTYYAAWKQTVTLNTGSQGSGSNLTPYIYLNGTALSSATVHSVSGYTLNGYYTAASSGTKVLNADGTLVSNVTGYTSSTGTWVRTGSTTLYAQWRAAAGKTCYTWDAEETTPATGTNNYGGLYLNMDQIGKYTFNSGGTNDTCYWTKSKANYMKGHINGVVIDSLKFKASSTAADKNAVVVAFCSTYPYDTAYIIKVNSKQCKVYEVNKNDAAESFIKIKAPAGTKSFALGRNFEDAITVDGTLENSGSRYFYYVEVCSAGGGTHTISYANGGGTGTMASNTGITDDGSQTLTTNSFTAPTNFAFAGWVADVNVTIGGSTVTAGTLISNGASLTNITSDIALTAVWSQTITLDDNDANHGATGDGSATVYYNATSLASITHTTAASGYKLSGYYTAATSGTKVLNSDGSFAGDDITDWIDDGKWTQSTTSTPTLYAQYEVAGSIKWNLQVNSADAPIVTSSKNSSYTQISTSNMTNLDSIGLNITASKKASMTSKISAPTAFDKDKYMKVTFQVASGYQFKPSSIKVPIQPVSGGADVKLVLVDNAATPDSIGKLQSSLSKGTLTTVEMTNSSAVFKGTVTLKIYCYGSSTGTYRLGTPIQIDGEIESTCTMPSYGSVSYSQTEYTVGDTPSSISVEDATGAPTYQWKYNSTGDRSSGTNGVTTASMSPSTASAGTSYYWCELTNACGTVKTPAVAITVSASKSDAPSIAWTDPASVNYGGGGYTIRATVNDASWDGNASDLTITAPAGIRIYNKTSGTTDSKKWVQVKFDVQTAFDRETYSSNIPFTVSADATTSYNAISADHNVSYSACSGGGGSATEELMAVDASHIDNSTWKGGWVYDGIGMMRYGHGSSDISAGTKDANLNDLSYTMASGDITKYYKSASNHFGFYTEKAITGIRLYVYTSNDNVTVSNVYVANSAYTSGTPSSGAVSFEAEYNDENDALRSGTHSGSAWVDITFDKEVAAEKYGQINLSNNVKIAGMAFISASGSGATLTTTLAFATTGTIAKTQSAANFTNAASVTAYSETLGAITYSSSNTDCATVDSKTGEVTITASGAEDLSTTITATLAASGCYKGATTTYTITVAGVSCSVTTGTLASDVTTKCSTADATLTLTGFESGATVQWYKGETTISTGGDYTITTDGTTSTLVTAVAGTYSVLVTNSAETCSDRSNSITISNYSAEVAATKIVDKWYIKHGRVTPDIALWALDEGTHLSSVAWSPSNATGLTAADDFYESDGIVYLKGTEPSSNESSDVEYTLTLTVKDECENTTALSTSDKQITLTHQKNTDKHVLAFVVNGTEKGGWTAGISADQTTNVELYNEIAKNFDVQATNIYSTDDEQKLKEYYSQFDILCITDYPNTKTKGVNSKSYVDAIGALIDIRPILTMEAWVSGLTNWKSKGISGTPKSPTTRQYSMLLQCKDHEIFSGTNPTTVGSGDETMYRIDMVDKTMEEYATLDATYGAGAHESDKNYQYGKKPALQGFTYDASMSSLLPIGRIDDGEGNDLEVGVERQAVMEARLLVLGINGYAMERLDDDGLTIVINALKYLMKKNAEDIADCSNYFVGGATGDETNWFNLENWSGSTLPDKTQEVRIVAPCVIDGDVARAASVKIVSGGTYNSGKQTANGSLTIDTTGTLIVEGKIYAATAPNFFEQRATEPEDLVIKADTFHTGTLIFDNEDGETQATIEMYSKSYWEYKAGKYTKYWSYVGMPIKDVHIPEYFYGAFTYYYNETAGWERRFDEDIMQPFEGIGLSMQTGHMETFKGTMVSTENVDVTLTSTAGYGDGDNLIGNSWTAPIQIANFDASDFGDALATIYIFNTGREGKTYVDATEENDGAATAGQWLGVPISVAGLGGYSGLKVIPAMNAFLVYNNAGTGTTTTVHLDYDKLVRDGAASNAQINEPMRAPKQDGRRKKKDVEGLMRIRVAGEKTNTDVWLMQDPRFTEAFDNGWEAYYSTCDNRSAQLYARSNAGKMAFLALPDLDGTVLGFAPSRDGNDYTFTFKYRGEDEYYLNDLKLQQSVLINADNSYAFTYEKGDTNRFYVSRTPLQAPQTPTGIGNTEGTSTQSTKAIKVIYNDKLYIIRGGRVYGADGSLVK